MSFLGGNSFKSSSSRGSDEGRRDRDRERERDRDAEALANGESTRLLNRLPAEEEAPPAYVQTEAPTFTKATATPPDKCSNIIANGAKWSGTLKVDDSVRIDGTFSGEVVAKGTVHVSEGAQVDAKIKAAFVVIGGNFRGEIRCEHRVDLLPRSRINGEVISRVLNVHEGAVLDGRVQMSGDGEAAAPTSRLTSRSSRHSAPAVEIDEPRVEESNGVHAVAVD
ncbi:MAG TPA: polymer-forming cytoskeletal protein [Dehalococcoidia bacterium]|nr:polymer-forming cytoskeletal protein [Dehalococcoidia bacterium]